MITRIMNITIITTIMSITVDSHNTIITAIITAVRTSAIHSTMIAAMRMMTSLCIMTRMFHAAIVFTITMVITKITNSIVTTTTIATTTTTTTTTSSSTTNTTATTTVLTIFYFYYYHQRHHDHNHDPIITTTTISTFLKLLPLVLLLRLYY